MQISNNFLLQEFVPKDIYYQFHNKSQWFIQKHVVEYMEAIRVRYGQSITINDWKWGGKFNYRGFRPPNSTVGAKLSQHRLGNAVDFNVKNMSCDEVREDILNNQRWHMSKGLTTIEDGAYAPTWVHVDFRQTRQDNILIVKP